MQSVKLNWLWYILRVVQPSPIPSFITQSRVPSALTPHCLSPAINNLPSYPCDCSGHFVPMEPTHNVISGNWLLSPVVMFSKLTHTVALISPLFLFQFSCLVVSNSLRPHEPQHARPPCPSPTAESTQTHVH